MIVWGDLWLALAAYVVMTASPGPATLSILATAAADGRSAALSLAAGVLCGSVLWGLVAAGGLGVLLATFGWVLTALKILGGLYLLWLAWGAARRAISPTLPAFSSSITDPRAFRRGLALHLTNPKAVFSWAAVITLGLEQSDSYGQIGVLLACCAGLGAAIFGGYAIVFSTSWSRAIYIRSRRMIETLLAGLFAAAGLNLLATRG
ncbi:MAG: LysE family transporter [Rhodobacteraceae bacterium]|nr:LysE family transporter [Paracoccaceae bacterium]